MPQDALAIDRRDHRARLRILVESTQFRYPVLGLIGINAIILGLGTSPGAMAAAGDALMLLDKIILWIFVAELALRIYAHGARFFRDPWGLFDFAIVAISLVLYGVGIGFTPVCLFALPSTILGSKRSGPNAFAVLMTGRNMGVLIGPMLLPQVLLWTGQWEMSGVVFGTITALDAIGAVILTLILVKLGRSRPD